MYVVWFNCRHIDRSDFCCECFGGNLFVFGVVEFGFVITFLHIIWFVEFGFVIQILKSYRLI